MRKLIIIIVTVFITGILVGFGVCLVCLNKSLKHTDLQTTLNSKFDFKAYLSNDDLYPILEVKNGLPRFNRVILLKSTVGNSRYQMELKNGLPILLREQDKDYTDQIVNILSSIQFYSVESPHLDKSFTISIVVDSVKNMYNPLAINKRSSDANDYNLSIVSNHFGKKSHLAINAGIIYPIMKSVVIDQLPTVLENDMFYIDSNNNYIVWRVVEDKISKIYSKTLLNTELTPTMKNLLTF